MVIGLALVWLIGLVLLKHDLGKASARPKFRQMLAKRRAINLLSAARMFLFAARDVWFVVALPVFLASQLDWSFWQVGGFMAAWVIGYGIVQSLAPWITGRRSKQLPDGRSASLWALLLAAIPGAMALALYQGLPATPVLIGGLLLFGIVFAINFSQHSYLIISHAQRDGVSQDVGFYYMANALGRLLGTLLSGWMYQAHGLAACLLTSMGMLIVAALVSARVPRPAHRPLQKYPAANGTMPG